MLICANALHTESSISPSQIHFYNTVFKCVPMNCHHIAVAARALHSGGGAAR